MDSIIVTLLLVPWLIGIVGMPAAVFLAGRRAVRAQSRASAVRRSLLRTSRLERPSRPAGDARAEPPADATAASKGPSPPRR